MTPEPQSSEDQPTRQPMGEEDHAELGLGAPGVPSKEQPMQQPMGEENHAELGLGAPGASSKEQPMQQPMEEGNHAELGLGAPGVPSKEQPMRQSMGEGNHAELGLGAPGGAPSGWYSRGYLPHYNNTATIQSVTFRLADSLPQSKLREIEYELVESPSEKMEAERRKRIDRWLDAGMGCCALNHPEVAALMQETLLMWDGGRYRLFAWCIMPNHVHVLIETKIALAKIIQSWKSFTGRWVMAKNAELGLGVPRDALWMREYWDRYIRNADHFDNVRAYIEKNPVAAGLCRQANEWPWSSASPGNAEPQLGAQ